MRIPLRTLFIVAGLSLIGNEARAQSQSLAWSEWETSAVVKRGPERAQAVLLYFHGRAPWDVTKNPIMSIFIEMAKVAEWDILRINRSFLIDREGHDAAILRFVTDRITDLRRDGYRKVIVGGGSGGGWLSLLAAALPGIDAVLAFAPGTTSGRMELLRTGKKLRRILAGARAPRIAVFFFEGDFLEDLEIRRSYMIRDGLEKSGSTFMIVDHPPDLYGHQAMGTGRLVRRYRDCLLKLVREADLTAGEIECSRSTGFAVGSDIGFPASTRSLVPSPGTNPALLPYLGRWEGDNESGAYLIMEATAVGLNSVTFAMVWSPSIGSSEKIWACTVLFQLIASDGSISDSEWGDFAARLKAPMELELDYRTANGEARTHRFLLHKRINEAAGARN